MNNYKDMADFLLGDADDADMLNHTYFEMTPARARHIALALQDQQKRTDELEADIKWLTSNRMKLEGEIIRLAALQEKNDETQ